MILSRRESYLAQLVARRVPYAEIAKKYGISVGRLKNIMLEIYEKLYISGRDELTKFIIYKKQ
jgi:DNA-binding CsgD family transcriptional regulator